MKRPIAILFMMLLFLQAIPVLHLFAEQNFYVYVDEDRPEESKVKDKKHACEYICTDTTFPLIITGSKPIVEKSVPGLPFPYLESLTPPPNTTC